MKLSKGFTLAEILVVIGIIGVVAAITLPTINTNVFNQQIYTSFRKAINTIETANALFLQKNSARTIDRCLKAVYNSETGYGDYLIMEMTPAVRVSTYDTKDSALSAIDAVYNLKDGTSILRSTTGSYSSIVREIKTASFSKLKQGYSGKYYYAYIDANGANKGPNTLGKDVFLVLIDTRGTVIPYGGEAHKAYDSANTALKTWQDSAKGCNKRPVGDAKTCAGSVIDNEKIIY